MTSSVPLARKLALSARFRTWLAPLAVSALTALLVVSPFFWLGSASGHDFSFHAASWLDAAGQWKEGTLFPRWNEGANYGFGEPRFLFYPPLSWLLGAALGSVIPWNAVPGAMIFLAQTLAGLCFFALARRFLSRGPALFGAACYATNPYALLVVYMRSDFAEQFGCAVMPLVVLGALKMCGLLEKSRRALPRSVALFALAFAVVWLSNAPAGVMASYTTALICAWAALEEKSLRPFWRAFFGLALGFGLTGFYLLPAAYEQKWVSIAQALASGLQPSENFLYTMLNDPEHNLFNWIASTVAILLIVITGIAAVFSHRNDAREKAASEKIEAASEGNSRAFWRLLLLLAVTATFLMIRPSSLLWTLLPKLRFLQFPWRWMAILALPYAYFLAAAAARARLRWAWGLLVLLAVAGTGTFLVRQAWWDTEDIPVLRASIAADQGFEGTDEYDPLGDDHYSLPQNAPRVALLPQGPEGLLLQLNPKNDFRIVRWTAEDREVLVNAQEPLRVTLRLLNYPAWRVVMNGKPVTAGHAEGTAQMLLPLPAGSQRITVHFARTRDRQLGIAITWLAGLTLLALLNAGGFRLLSASP